MIGRAVEASCMQNTVMYILILRGYPALPSFHFIYIEHTVGHSCGDFGLMFRYSQGDVGHTNGVLGPHTVCILIYMVIPGTFRELF